MAHTEMIEKNNFIAKLIVKFASLPEICNKRHFREINCKRDGCRLRQQLRVTTPYEEKKNKLRLRNLEERRGKWE